MVEPPEPDVDDLDPQLGPRRRRDGGQDLVGQRVEPPDLRRRSRRARPGRGGRWRRSARPRPARPAAPRPPRASPAERRNRDRVGHAPDDVAGDLQVPLVAGDHLARRRVEHLEPPVDRQAALPRPLQVQARLARLVAIDRDRPAELGDDARTASRRRSPSSGPPARRGPARASRGRDRSGRIRGHGCRGAFMGWPCAWTGPRRPPRSSRAAVASRAGSSGTIRCRDGAPGRGRARPSACRPGPRRSISQ